MGFTCCYKMESFYIYICSFSTVLYAISVSDTCLRSCKSISIPNIDGISQSMAKIKLLPVSILISVVIGIPFSIFLSNFVAIARSAAEL